MASELNGGTTGIEAPTAEPATPVEAPAPRRLAERLAVATASLRVRTPLGSPTEPVSPHEVQLPAPEVAPAATDRPEARSMRLRLALCAVSGVVGGLVIAATSPVWWLAPIGAWRFTLPGVPHPGSSLFSSITFVGGVVLLALAWIGLIGAARRQAPTTSGWRGGLGVVTLIALAWAVPFLLAPPQLSNDAYSYAAQGEMASQGIDPTATGPNSLPRNSEFWRAADPIWRDAPAPYGPLGIASSEFVVVASGHDAATAIWGFRLLAALGVVAAAVGVVTIARTRGVSPQLAFVLGVANPVVLLHLIGGSHNDALMMGLLVAGLACFETGRKVLAVLLVTAATAVKLPAAIALAFIAWNWVGRDARLRQRFLALPVVGLAAGALLAVSCLVAGVGVGWITALRNTGKITSTFSVFTKLGYLSSDLLHWVGIENNAESVMNLGRLVGLAVSGGILLYLLVRSPKIGVSKAVGLGLLAVVLCGPVVWPWYLPAAFALIAAGGVRRFRPTMMILVIAASALVWPTSVNPIDGLNQYQHWLGFGVVLLITASCGAAQFLARFAESRRVQLGLPPLADGVETGELGSFESRGSLQTVPA